ncbi:DUF1758 domain-containing protein, partial [Aphis craccivora]
MYRLFRVADEHRTFQQILWRTNPKENIKNVDPVVSEVIKRDFYMDDFLNGANSYEEACQLRNNLIKTMQSAGLELRKWSSNNINLIKDIPNNREGNKTKPISDDNSITKIL